MYLRSGLRYRSGGNISRDQVSQVSTEESVNQAEIEHLSAIHEEVISDTSSEVNYSYSMERYPGMDLHGEMGPIGTSKSHEEKRRMLLQYLFTNQKGARIYLDSDNLHYVREDLGKSTFLEQINAYYREDRYFDDDGIAYIRTEYPNLVDPMDMIEPRDKVDAGMERPPLENDVRAKFISIKKLERIVVDDPRVGLYRLVTPTAST